MRHGHETKRNAILFLIDSFQGLRKRHILGILGGNDFMCAIEKDRIIEDEIKAILYLPYG